MRYAGLWLCLLLLLAGESIAATITVNTTVDEVLAGDGCSLREAIMAANSDSNVNECAAGAGSDLIAFAVPGSGPHEIVLETDLPVIVTPLTIDGRTQPGAYCPFGPAISITGASDVVEHGFRFEAGADGSAVFGMKIHGLHHLKRGFWPLIHGVAVHIQDLSGFELGCNVFGVDLNQSVQGIVGYGLRGFQVSDLHIGGRQGGWYDNSASNVMVGHYGVRLSGVDGMDAAGNWIGFAPPGVATDYDYATGIEVFDGASIHIGVLPDSPHSGGGNVLTSGGIIAIEVSSITAYGNRIGVFPDGRELPAGSAFSVQWIQVSGASEFGRWQPGSDGHPLANIVSDQGDGIFGANVTGGLSISFWTTLDDPIQVSGNLFLGPVVPRDNFYSHGLIAEQGLDKIVLSNNAFTRWPAAVTVFSENGAYSDTSGNNCFEGNDIAVFNPFPGRAALALPNNWWGSADGPGGSAPGHGDPVDPDVEYQPFLTERPASCALLSLAAGSVFPIPDMSGAGLILLGSLLLAIGTISVRTHRRIR